MRRGSVGSMLDIEVQLAAFGLEVEVRLDRGDDIGEQEIFGVDRHRARLDLRQVEDVGDQVEQVGACAVNGAREFDLLRRQVAAPGCRRAADRESGCC